MAVYKRDIIDINLETGNIYRSWLKHSIGYKDQKADHFGVRVFRDGEAVSLTGVSVQGVFMPPQGSPIAITSGNIVSGNVAEVVLPQACYNYDGQFTLAIKLVDSTNSVTGTVRIVDGMVDNTHASGTVAPTSAVPTYQEVLSVYEQAIVVIGKSVRFDTDQSLTDAQKTTARTNIAAASTGELSDLKSAFVSFNDDAFDGYIINPNNIFEDYHLANPTLITQNATLESSSPTNIIQVSNTADSTTVENFSFDIDFEANTQYYLHMKIRAKRNASYNYKQHVCVYDAYAENSLKYNGNFNFPTTPSSGWTDWTDVVISMSHTAATDELRIKVQYGFDLEFKEIYAVQGTDSTPMFNTFMSEEEAKELIAEEGSILDEFHENVFNGFIMNPNNIFEDYKLEDVTVITGNVTVETSSPTNIIEVSNTTDSTPVENFSIKCLLDASTQYYLHVKVRARRNASYAYKAHSCVLWAYGNGTLKYDASFTFATTPASGWTEYEDYRVSLNANAAADELRFRIPYGFDLDFKEIYIVKGTDSTPMYEAISAPYVISIGGGNYKLVL